MPNFTVYVTEEVTRYLAIEIDAPSAASAEEFVNQLVRTGKLEKAGAELIDDHVDQSYVDDVCNDNGTSCLLSSPLPTGAMSNELLDLPEEWC